MPGLPLVVCSLSAVSLIGLGVSSPYHVMAILLPINLYVALRVGVAVIFSQRPTLGTIEYFTNRFCGETYVLAGVLKSQVFKLCFGAKSFVLGKKLARLRKEEDRWSQPAPTVGPMQVLYIGRFSIFPGTWPNLFWVRQCDGETWKKKRKKDDLPVPVRSPKSSTVERG